MIDPGSLIVLVRSGEMGAAGESLCCLKQINTNIANAIPEVGSRAKCEVLKFR